MAPTKSKGRKNTHDKFYTRPEIAAQCISLIDLSLYDTIIEPSAGAGSFSLLLPGCLAFDLHPEHPSILQKDWFTHSASRSDGKTLVLGNPPFGVQNSLAVRFINHAATFAHTIAFILPASFRKESVQSRLNRHLHLVHESRLEKNAFELEGDPYHIPAVFQVWEWREELRSLPEKVLPLGFEFTTREKADIWVRRVGGTAGRAGADPAHRSVQTHYFIALYEPAQAPEVVSLLNAVDYPERDDAAGPRSIPKSLVTRALNPLLASLGEASSVA